jgi:hypothetical protein
MVPANQKNAWANSARSGNDLLKAENQQTEQRNRKSAKSDCKKCERTIAHVLVLARQLWP